MANAAGNINRLGNFSKLIELIWFNPDYNPAQDLGLARCDRNQKAVPPSLINSPN